jgi:hypothetical protein
MTYVTFVLLGSEIRRPTGHLSPSSIYGEGGLAELRAGDQVRSDMGHGQPAAGQPTAGQRVVVRSVVVGERGPSGGPAMTDVVGILELADDREVVVRRRDGTTKQVARADIVTMMAVPPAPPRRPGRPTA